MIDKDNPENVNDGKARDSEYDNEHDNVDTDGNMLEEGRLPLRDYEHFEDPDFDKAWNSGENDEWEDLT